MESINNVKSIQGQLHREAAKKVHPLVERDGLMIVIPLRVLWEGGGGRCEYPLTLLLKLFELVVIYINIRPKTPHHFKGAKIHPIPSKKLICKYTYFWEVS